MLAVPARRRAQLIEDAPLLRSLGSATTSRRTPMLILPAIDDTDPIR